MFWGCVCTCVCVCLHVCVYDICMYVCMYSHMCGCEHACVIALKWRPEDSCGYEFLPSSLFEARSALTAAHARLGGLRAPGDSPVPACTIALGVLGSHMDSMSSRFS